MLWCIWTICYKSLKCCAPISEKSSACSLLLLTWEIKLNRNRYLALLWYCGTLSNTIKGVPKPPITKETSLMGHQGGFLFSDGQDWWDESQERRQDEKRLDFHLRAILGKKASQLPTRAKAVHEVESGAKNTKLLHYLVWGLCSNSQYQTSTGGSQLHY